MRDVMLQADSLFYCWWK